MQQFNFQVLGKESDITVVELNGKKYFCGDVELDFIKEILRIQEMFLRKFCV